MSITNGLYDSGMYPTSNTGWQREIIFQNERGKFKVKVISESVSAQSYARALKWSDQVGWCEIACLNTKRDFEIDIVFKEKKNLTGKEFDKAIDTLVKLCGAF